MKRLTHISTDPRVTVIDMADDGGGGAFMVQTPTSKLKVVASCGLGWDHVSVSLKNRTPRYQEMKMVKRIFFEDDEWAMELHPPGKSYISVNDNVLHLWRPHVATIPTPPKELV